MGRKPSHKKRYNFVIESSVYKDFSILCGSLGRIRSKVLEECLRDVLSTNAAQLPLPDASRRSGKVRYNFLIDPALYAQLSELCDNLGYVRSKVVERSLLAFINHHRDLLADLKEGAS